MQAASVPANDSSNWSDQLTQLLTVAAPFAAPPLAKALQDESCIHTISSLFDGAYQRAFDPQRAVIDLHLIDQLLQEIASRAELTQNSKARTHAEPVSSQLSMLDASEGLTRWTFRIFQAGSAIALSDILPLLEHFGFRILGETAFALQTAALPEPIFEELETGRRAVLSLHVFELELHDVDLADKNVDELCALFEMAFQQVWHHRVASDNFNQLLFRCGLGWRHIEMFRAYANYMKQIRLPYMRPSIANALGSYPEITEILVKYFNIRFDPHNPASNSERTSIQNALQDSFIAALDSVDNLTEDKILREYMQLFEATLRTSFFKDQQASLGEHCLAFKFDGDLIENLPKPRPRYEVFVYDLRVQGVHLRGGKVARGGLRWSDRFEDFRTEILGLVKAQQVKNAVIVPMGAKGGFICTQKPIDDSREAFLQNGVDCYRLFINTLLSVTDNLVEGQVVKPEQIVCWDGDDPYFVVAADKGTATFSDVANEISERRGFWLGDAFASGGSVGYDHKAMGITARGAWVAVQRHFRELGKDIQTEPFTAVAVGDMAGDVFGNGMLCSEQTRLVAAFNHLHIFIDPNPDATSSYAERKRLFDNVQGWDAYNTDLISKGGGVFSRRAKSIPLSDEVRSWLKTSEQKMAPNQLIKAILKAETDLLWNGGIGTYVKSSVEADSDVGDRANDDLRVNGNELGARVLGEGGNLGATQLGRVEFCLNGGRCNTDFIDNAGGVDCSDHEVNIKILLGDLLDRESINANERNTLLFEMTEEVSALVLHNNYRQTQAISMIEREARLRNLEYRRFIDELERHGTLDRAVEFMPTDEELVERSTRGETLTRPEISVLVSYAKLSVKSALLESSVFEDALVRASAEQAFPERLRQRYGHVIQEHRLHREIIATQIASNMVNRMGVNFVQRMQEATGESVTTIARAYLATIELFDIEQQWQAIESLDGKITSEQQCALFANIVRLVRRSTRWLLRRCRSKLDSMECVRRYKHCAEHLLATLPSLLDSQQLERFEAQQQKFVDQGVPATIASFIASSPHLYNVFALQRIAEDTSAPLSTVCEAFFELGEALQLNWFGDQITQMSVDNYWQALARESFRDELESQQALLATNWLTAIDAEDHKRPTFVEWTEQYSNYVERWSSMMNELVAAHDMEVAMYPVALRELLDLVQASEVKASIAV